MLQGKKVTKRVAPNPLPETEHPVFAATKNSTPDHLNIKRNCNIFPINVSSDKSSIDESEQEDYLYLSSFFQPSLQAEAENVNASRPLQCCNTHWMNTFSPFRKEEIFSSTPNKSKQQSRHIKCGEGDSFNLSNYHKPIATADADVYCDEGIIIVSSSSQVESNEYLLEKIASELSSEQKSLLNELGRKVEEHKLKLMQMDKSALVNMIENSNLANDLDIESTKNLGEVLNPLNIETFKCIFPRDSEDSMTEIYDLASNSNNKNALNEPFVGVDSNCCSSLRQNTTGPNMNNPHYNVHNPPIERFPIKFYESVERFDHFFLQFPCILSPKKQFSQSYNNNITTVFGKPMELSPSSHPPLSSPPRLSQYLKSLLTGEK